MKNTNSHRGFKCAIIALFLFFAMLVLNVLMKHSERAALSTISGVAVFSIAIMANIGLVYSLKGIREPRDAKKFAGLLINSAFVFLFICVIIANVVDLKRAFD